MKRLPFHDSFKEIDALIRSGKWTDAKKYTLKLVESEPILPGLIERAMYILRQLEDWSTLSDLLIDYRNRYGLNPDGSNLLIGQSLVELAQWHHAIPYLLSAFEENKNDYWSYHFLGKAYRHTGNLQKALSFQKKASQMLPDFAWAPFEVSQILMELNKPVEASLELNEARTRYGGPNEVIDNQWKKVQNLACIAQIDHYNEIGDLNHSFALINQAIALDPDNEILCKKLEELIVLTMQQKLGVAKENLSTLEKDLSQIEVILDQLEANVRLG